MISYFSKHKKLSIVVILGLLVLVSASIAVICFSPKPTGLLHAYQIAYDEACKYCDKPTLYMITSIDEPGSTSADGKNGKRRYWNTVFSDSSDKTILITIHDKSIVSSYEIQESLDKTQLIDMTNFKFSSEEAVSIAASQYGLLPGKDWAVGYHFVLRRFSNLINLQVVGLNEKNQRTRIAFDSNGVYTQSLVKN